MRTIRKERQLLCDQASNLSLLVIINFWWRQDGVTVLFEDLIKPMDMCHSMTQLLKMLTPALEFLVPISQVSLIDTPRRLDYLVLYLSEIFSFQPDKLLEDRD